MQSEKVAKIALHVVKLPKFETVHGKAWLLRTTVAKDLRHLSRLT